MRASFLGNPDTDRYRGGGPIVGNDHPDRIFAVAGSYVIDAGGGGDIVATGRFDDTIIAGPGDDTVFSYAGNNFIDAGPGNDRVATGDGDDTVLAGAGDDAIETGGGNDRVEFGTASGAKRIELGAGDDTAVLRVEGRDVPDIKIFGGEGFDTFTLVLTQSQAQNGYLGLYMRDLQRNLPLWSTWDPSLEERPYYAVGFEAFDIVAPVLARDDVASTIETRPVDIHILENDADLLGDVERFADTNEDLVITDVDTSKLAPGATVTIENGRTLRFDPGDAYRYLAAGETLDVEIGYTIADHQGFSDTARAIVTITGTEGRSAVKVVPIFGSDGEAAGSSVAIVGDVNGDGRDDMLVGALGNEAGGEGAGAAYLIYGRAGTNQPFIELSDIADDTDRTDGFMIVGETPSLDVAYLGSAVSSAGDFNGDGFGDFVIGSTQYPSYEEDTGGTGAAYVIYGRAGKRQGTIDLDDIADGSSPAEGFKLVGEHDFDFAGDNVASAGDVNGDGFDDLLVTAFGNGESGAVVYVIYGREEMIEGTFELAEITDNASTSDGFALIGSGSARYPGEHQSVASADVNGDGLSDILVSSGVGAYVIYGNEGDSQTNIKLSDISNDRSTRDGFEIVDPDGYARGTSVASAGDINGDGREDILIGASGDDEGGRAAGAAFVVYGKAGREQGKFDLADIENGDTSLGFKIIGEAEGDGAGYSVSSAGDVNGDGEADLLIGTNRALTSSPNITGAAYLGFGTGSDPSTIYLSDIAAGIGGVKLSGRTRGDDFGESVSAAGDVNNDGYDDLLIGAMGVETDERGSGAAYLVYGAEDWSGFDDIF